MFGYIHVDIRSGKQTVRSHLKRTTSRTTAGPSDSAAQHVASRTRAWSQAGSATEPDSTPTPIGPFQGLNPPEGSVPAEVMVQIGSVDALTTSEEMGTLNRLIQEYYPNADVEQPVDQPDPQENVLVEVPEEVVQISDESRGKVDKSREKGPAVSPLAAPLLRKRKVIHIPEALPEIPAVLHLTLPDHAPAIARYPYATRSAFDGDYYAALTHAERYNCSAYHATQVGPLFHFFSIFPP